MDDPNWAAFVPETPSGGAKCRLPAHDDCTPLDADAVAGHLQPGGVLGGMAGYESRPGQIDMLRAVTRAFNGREHLMIEAGTGVGKSLAYLIPAVQWSVVNDTPVVVATATRNLQSQLVLSDLPRAARTLGADAAGLRTAVLKGRANYLCLRAMGEFMQGGWWTLDDAEKAAFRRLVAWLKRTADGDLDTLGADDLRRHLSCAGEDCAGRACPYRSRCFIAKARTRAAHAHVVIANHALVLAEAACAAANLLPAYGRLILDEAHNLEDAATEFFSWELSRPALAQLLGKLARPARSRRGGERTRGILGAVERQMRRGGLPSAACAEEIRELVLRAHVQDKFVREAGEGLFTVLKRLFSPAPKRPRIRFRCVPGECAGGVAGTRARQYALNGLFATYTAAQWDEEALTAAAMRFEEALAVLQKVLAGLADALQRASGDAPAFGDLAVQTQGVAAQFTDFMLEAKCILAASDPSRVHWAERCTETGRGARGRPYIRLVAAPLSVADEMKRIFYDVKDSVILCSATLRTGDRFDYMARKLGVAAVETARVRTLTAASPFNYFRQALTLAPDFLPDPAADAAAYVARLAPFLAALFGATRGRGLVLFTSYDMMRATEEAARPLLEADGLRLLVQGDGLSREAMTEALKKAETPTVLFGAQSFWEGVDVPGAALSCVVIARLPFPQAGEPIVEARGENVTENGGSAFRDYLLPEALIRFRQGFGRLIRAKSDRGVVVIADSRLVAKNYGAVFRKALPAAVHTVSCERDLLARATDFLSDA